MLKKFKLGRNSSGRSTDATGSGPSKAIQSPDVHRLTVSEGNPSESGTAVSFKKHVTEHDKNYHDFGSRKEAYEKLMKALRDEKDGVIGIYGLPGIGKTQMMVQAWEQAKKEKKFDKVMIAHVGREGNVKNIKDQLDGSLNSHLLSKDDESDKASQVEKSLNEGSKTLVMLDDIWNTISLEEIGISLVDGSPDGYKILLTSNTRDVCYHYNCNDLIEINKLTDEEAKRMFRNIVDIPEKEINKSQKDLVEGVYESCQSLPLLIRAVGSAFKNVPEDLRSELLEQIKYGRSGWIDAIEPQVYACLKMSFYKLTKDVKTCLFLCTLFPESAVIDIEMLSDFATGSDPLLESKEDMSMYIRELKSYYLLVQDNDDRTIRIPIIIRDVARSVATRDPDFASADIRCKSWLPDNVNYSTRKVLHLDLQGEDVGFPNDQVSPDLRFLWLDCNNHKQQLSGGLFTSLKCLLIKGMVFSDNEWPTGSMKELRTLILDSCELHVTFVCFIPDHLETLRIRNSHFPAPNHNHILQPKVLANLITLEISRCRGSKFLFPAAVANSFEKMEEFKIEKCREMEEIVSVDGSTDGDIISFPELKSLTLDDLPKLTHFYKDNIASSSSSFFSDKVKFPSMKKPKIRKVGYETHFGDLKVTFSEMREMGTDTSLMDQEPAGGDSPSRSREPIIL